MNKQETISEIKKYSSTYKEEQVFIYDIQSFVHANDDYYLRSNLAGHITASAWILSPDHTHALLIHHVKLDRWFQPGGHVDDTDTNISEAAIREAIEETGLSLELLQQGIFDIDIHTIPAKKAIPEHLHYDIRYLMQAKSLELDMNTVELKGIKWVSLRALKADENLDQSLRRMVLKSFKFNV